MAGTKRGRKKQEWAQMTWVHANGSELTIESDTKKHCMEMFFCNVDDPLEWRKKR